MSDERFRKIERRFLETGSLEDEGALLRERVRDGLLGDRTLEILAELGHAASRAARGLAPLAVPRVSESIAAFQERLAETIVWCETRASKSGADALRDPALAVSFAERLRASYPPHGGWRFRSEEMPAWVEEIRARRRALLEASGWLAGARTWRVGRGRLLAYTPDANISDSASDVATRGFFDCDDVPPWDTWVSWLPGHRYAHLLCWIPESHVALADDGIRANAIDCIQWMTPRDARGGSWYSPEIERFIAELDRAGLA